MPEYVVESIDLCKKYGKTEVLKDLNVHIPKGSIYGLVGKNGAGKTTFMRIICGVQNPSSGNYKLFGCLNTDSTAKKSRQRIGAIIETPAICPEFSAVDNMKQQYRYLGIPSWDGIDELLKTVGLSDTGRKKAKNFSLGMKQRLGLAMILAGNPDLIVLDEPMNGLDPAGIIEMRELIVKLNKERDITVVISSHILDELSKVATHYGFIDGGKLVEEMAADELDGKCRKSSTLVVNDTQKMSKLFETRGVEYVIESDEKIVIYGEIDVNEYLPEMVNQGIKMISFYQTNETLESYYLSLIEGGQKDE